MHYIQYWWLRQTAEEKKNQKKAMKTRTFLMLCPKKVLEQILHVPYSYSFHRATCGKNFVGTIELSVAPLHLLLRSVD